MVPSMTSEIEEEDMVERPDLVGVKRRLALRSSNAAVPIPSGKRKRPRSRLKQDLREENR